MGDFASIFQEQLSARNKSLSFVARFTGLDRAYLSRLHRGLKRDPSPEVIVKIWIALVADEEQFKEDPSMPYGLTELLQAAGFGATARSS